MIIICQINIMKTILQMPVSQNSIQINNNLSHGKYFWKQKITKSTKKSHLSFLFYLKMCSLIEA